MNNEYLERLVAVEQRCKSNTKRLDEIDSKNAEQDRKIIELSDIYIALTKVDTKLDNVETICKKNASDIEEIKSKPIKRIDAIWGYFFSALIGSVVTSVLATIFANLIK